MIKRGRMKPVVGATRDETRGGNESYRFFKDTSSGFADSGSPKKQIT